MIIPLATYREKMGQKISINNKNRIKRNKRPINIHSFILTIKYPKFSFTNIGSLPFIHTEIHHKILFLFQLEVRKQDSY